MDEQKKQNPAVDKLEQLMQAPDSTSEFDPLIIEQNKALAILCYLVFFYFHSSTLL